MKRVFSYLITSLFVLGFALGAVGCSGDLMDKELNIPEHLYAVGDATPNGWSTSTATANESTEGKNIVWNKIKLSPGSVKFIEAQGTASDWADCGTQYGKNGPGNNQDTWTVDSPGFYKMTLNMEDANNSSKAGGALTLELLPTPESTLDGGVNDTTMAQDNAYIEIVDDNAANKLRGKYYFNKVGDHYVATIPFDLTGASFADWGNSGAYWMGWGKINVGDGVTLTVTKKQFGTNSASNSTTIQYVDEADGHKDNMGFSTMAVGTKGVITITTSESSNTVAATIYP